MIKGFAYPLYFVGSTVLAGGLFCAVLFAAETGILKQADQEDQSSHHESLYSDGDWNRYILNNKEYSTLQEQDVSEPEDIFEAEGSFNFGLMYGHTRFTKEKYRLSPDDKPSSLVIQDGFTPVNDYKLLVQGRAGKRLSVFVDHDSKRENRDENKYVVNYRAVKDDEILRELNAGDIDVAAIGSKYALFESKAEKAYGMDMTLKKGAMTLKAFGSITKGNDDTDVFRGRSSPGSLSVAEYQYIRNKYYQLEPYRRFDGITNSASVLALGASAFTTLITFTSQPAIPASYVPASVPIEAGSLELWIDDQTEIKKSGTFLNPPDNGSYSKLSEGTDFTANYNTGEITFNLSLTDQSRVFALYRLTSGSVSSCDPAARTDIIPGKIFIFIKYGTQIEEDPDHDGTSNGDMNKDLRVNHDVYEIRSRYSLLEKGILSESLRIELYKDNRYVSQGLLLAVGRYETDCVNGIVKYFVREPFRPLLTSNEAATIYGPSGSRIYESSHYSQKVSYFREARVFQLKHMNIVEGSVSVKVNGAIVAPSLYAVHYMAGVVEFSNPNDPVIGETTVIEIRYQYSALAGVARGFTGGLRGDYRINDMLAVGGTVLYSRQGTDEKIPNPGEEPTMNAVFEGDASLHLGPSRLGKLASAVTGNSAKDVPVEFNGYAEYARSYKNNNTFGKVLVDDMETAAEAVTLSVNEQDWFLSSLPASATRGMLYYKYYRDPSSPDTLKDESFSPYVINYAVKGGPYNLLAGHNSFASSDMNSSRRALVFDFDLSTGGCASAAVRIDKKDTDLSGLQYVEIWYRASAGAGTVDLSLDVGSITEDSDGDGILDTEDANHNGYLDVDFKSGTNEDIGYLFNPGGYPPSRAGNGPGLNNYTTGDGVLSTEDINNNGLLDTTESNVSFPGVRAFLENDTAYQPLSVTLTDTTWKSAKIYLRREAMTESERQTLLRSRAVRLNVRGATGTTGRIMIDSVRFVSAKWKDIRIAGALNENPDRFKVSIVDTLNDSDYNAHSFIREKGGEYQSLYGNRTSDELNDEKESALSISYNLSGVTGSVNRIFQKGLDLGNYKTFVMWVNSRSLTSGDILRVCIGSSDSDYIQYDTALSITNYWQELSFKLKEASSGSIAVTARAGYPELTCIRYIRIELLNTAPSTGKLWVNNLMASDPEASKGSAYWYEGSLKAIRPVYVTDGGTPLINNFLLSYIQKRHDAEYASPGRTDNGIFQKERDMRTSFSVLPRLDLMASVSSKTEECDSFSDSLSPDRRGSFDNNNYFVQLDYRSVDIFIPTVSIAYRGEKKDIYREDLLTTGGKSLTENALRTHAPKITIEERLEDFIGGRWIIGLISDNLFQVKNDRRGEGGIISESEARQKNDLQLKVDYEYGYFSMTPELSMLNHEVTTYSGTSSTDIVRDPGGDFHVPFFGDENKFKFAERNIASAIRFAARKTEEIFPAFMIEYKYNQNGFKDFLDAEVISHPEYTRQHNAQSSVLSDISFPVVFKETLFGFIKSLTFRYSRKAFLDETAVPYEGEKKGLFDEKYGMSQSFSPLFSMTNNLIEYYPGYFLKGRGNYGKGRDHLNKTLNSSAVFNSGNNAAYTNSLRLMENTSISPVFQFRGFDIISSTGFDHLCERSSIGAVPGQQITWNARSDVSIDLMQIMKWGFFRPNTLDNERHGAKFNVGYAYSRSALITKNIQEDKHSPTAGFVLLWGVSALSIKGSIDFRHLENHMYISPDYDVRDRRDDIYYDAMNKSPIDEKNKGYTVSCKYETQIHMLKEAIEKLFPILYSPLLSVEYEFVKNRYYYTYTISPEPYDRHMLTSILKLDLHKNVKGSLQCRAALERWYNRDTHGLYREVASYEIGGQISIQF